jgi:ABC-type branched-subunit amino acid transport system substrate-binding protein
MYKISTFFILGVLFFSLSSTDVRSIQSETDVVFNTALDYYQNRDYRQAAEIFLTLSSPEASLMAGKSLFALGNFTDAKEALSNVHPEDPPYIYQEAKYTRSLIYLNSRSFANALDILDGLRHNVTDENLAQLAEDKISAFNRFLLPEQRIAAVRETANNKVREELLMYGVRNSSREDGQLFINEAVNLDMNASFVAALRRNMTYFVDDVQFEPEVPDNFVYNIGVLLPQQVRETSPFRVSRELYFGLLMAVNEFNQENERRTFALKMAEIGNNESFQQANEDTDREEMLRLMFKDLVENQQADIIFGPLFSEDAEIVARLANEFRVPVIAPLANAEHLSEFGSYFFQANPTFSVRGRKMADTAVKTLGLKNLAVLVDRNSTGAIEAKAFREKAEALGAEIVHYFNIDFREQRFNVSRQTQYFASSMEVVDDTLITLRDVDAVFLPFTGGASNTMIDIVLTDLQVYKSNVDILGSEDWGMAPLSREAIRRFNITYSGIFKRNNQSELSQNFRARYQNLFSKPPDIFGKNGYDAGNFIISSLLEAGNPSLAAEIIRNHPFYEGIGQNIFFDGGQVNTAVEARLITTDGFLLLE